MVDTVQNISTFGHAGVRTVHESAAAGLVRASAGDFVICTVDVRGSIAQFKFACQHRDLFVPESLSQSRYQWTDLDGDPGAGDDVHTLDLRFTGATYYRYRMELFAEDTTLLETLKDIEYESTDSRDFYLEPIRLRIQ